VDIFRDTIFRMSECKVNLGSRKSSRSNSLWQMTTKTVSSNHWATVANGIASALQCTSASDRSTNAINTDGGAYWAGRAAAARSLFAPYGRPYRRSAYFWRESWDFFSKVECIMTYSNKFEWKVNLHYSHVDWRSFVRILPLAPKLLWLIR